MSAVGIVSEYNPFHNGHAYNIEEARRVSGRENVIVAMSASFTQRGEPACFDKFTRAAHALKGGADMVIEIPDVLSCACAERFCAAGVRLLAATGLVDSIAFGSECGDIARLTQLSEMSIDEDAIRAELKRGVSYPKAISNVMLAGEDGSGDILPNDILAVEYLRALKKYAQGIRPFAVKRVGAGYNSDSLSEEYAAASAIRASVSRGDIPSVKEHIPGFVYEDMLSGTESGSFPAALDSLACALIYKLRTLGISGIARLADVSEGLERVIYRSALEARNAGELLRGIKSKRYSLARIRRILCYALLGTDKALQCRAATDDGSIYIRVLGVKKDRVHLLSELAERSKLPVIKKLSDADRLTSGAHEVLEHTRKASLIRALACPVSRRCDDDFSARLITV